MFDRIEVIVDPELTAAFPARRLTAVEIELADGRRLAGRTTRSTRRAGGPGAAGAMVADKVSRADRLRRDQARGSSGRRGLRDQTAEQLLALMCDAAPVAAGA